MSAQIKLNLFKAGKFILYSRLASIMAILMFCLTVIFEEVLYIHSLTYVCLLLTMFFCFIICLSMFMDQKENIFDSEISTNKLEVNTNKLETNINKIDTLLDNIDNTINNIDIISKTTESVNKIVSKPYIIRKQTKKKHTTRKYTRYYTYVRYKYK